MTVKDREMTEAVIIEEVEEEVENIIEALIKKITTKGAKEVIEAIVLVKDREMTEAVTLAGVEEALRATMARIILVEEVAEDREGSHVGAEEAIEVDKEAAIEEVPEAEGATSSIVFHFSVQTLKSSLTDLYKQVFL